MFKIKVTPEEKIKSVESYLQGEISISEIAGKYQISIQSVTEWIRKYESFGAEGLLSRSKILGYSEEVKRLAVEDYLAGKGSQSEICKRYKIHSRNNLQKWIKVYNSHRELRPSTGRGSEIYMTKGRNTTYEERVEIVSYCIERGNDYTAAIEKYGVSYQQIYSWVRKYNEKGAIIHRFAKTGVLRPAVSDLRKIDNSGSCFTLSELSRGSSASPASASPPTPYKDNRHLGQRWRLLYCFTEPGINAGG